MSNAFFVPFNFQPVNTGRGNESSTYTVPSGKYARVMITLQAEVYTSSAETTGSYSDSKNDCNHVTVELWLDEGEVLDFTSSNSAATNIGSGNQFAFHTSSAQITADVDGNPVSICRARGTFASYNSTGNFSTGNDMAAVTNAEFRYEEFNKIS